ncbi:MAG: adenosyl-hopene transferase HpnH, partial [Dehalococcoidia bacterium]
MMHPHIGDIVEGIIRRKKFVYLCTNALLFKKAFKVIPPSPYFSFVVHLDGLRETHDIAVDRQGVYDVAIKMIEEAKERGYRICTNTTLYNGTRPEEYHQFFAMLNTMGVEGMMVSPGFEYKEVGDQPIFLQRQQAQDFFRRVFQGCKKGTRFYNNPLYRDFLQGQRHYQCSMWTVPTYTVMGWRQPCYLLATEGHATTFAELMETTPWDRYGYGKDRRCDTCMMHCGYEGSAILEALAKPSVGWQLFKRTAFTRD